MGAHARIYHIFESVQYGILYLIAAFIGGVGLDFSFPPYDSKKQTWPMFREVLAQCVMLVLVVYFVRVCVKSVPILFPVAVGSKYVPYMTPEFNGEMMMGFVFLGSQLNLVQKIDALAIRLYRWLFNEERAVEDGIENHRIRRAKPTE